MYRLGIFVDAGYLWVQLTKGLLGYKASRNQISLDFEGLREAFLKIAKEEFPDSRLLRVYWYDGPGNSGKGEDHAAIEMLDDFKLRLGTRNRVGQQKGVDGLIIADIISLTQNRAISDALLVSGDADLAPGVAAVQGLGLRVHLLTLGGGKATSPYLVAEVDRKHSWEDDVLHGFASLKSSEYQDAKIITVEDEEVANDSSGDTVDYGKSLDEVVEYFLRIQGDEDKDKMKEGRLLPYEYDKDLLRIASKKIGRRLEEDEKRYLRDKVKMKITAS